MSPLQKAPRGLLELLRLRTQGEQPTRFSDTLQPSIEAGAFYAADLLFSTQGGTEVGAINSNNGLTAQASPQQDPQWLVALGGALTLGAVPGTFFEWWIQINLPASGAPGAILASGRIGLFANSTNDVMPFGIMLPQRLVVPAGAFYRVGVHGDGTGTDHSLNARYLVANLSSQ